MIPALLLVPTLAALVAYVIRSNTARRAILVGAAVVHAALTTATWVSEPEAWWGGWLALDGPGRLFLGITSALFLAAAVYGVASFRREAPGERTDFQEGFLFDNAPEATFTACLLLFLAAMTLVTVSQAFGLLW